MHSDVEISVRKELRALRLYAVAMTVVSALALVGATSAWRNSSFNELTVHRLNVVDANGTVRLALFNKENEPGPIIAGKELAKRTRAGGTRAGMFFFNDLGDEQGGLTFSGDEANGNAALLSFDPFRQNDDMDLSFSQQGHSVHEGIAFRQQADAPLTVFTPQLEAARALPPGPKREAKIQAVRQKGFLGRDRVVVGVDDKQQSAIVLDDGQGRARLRIRVTPAGEAVLEFLDAKGRVKRRLSSE